MSLPKRLLFTGFLSFFYSVMTFLVVLALAWLILAKQDFAYEFWHDNVGIAEGIEKYGPKNRYRKGFADTTPEQRFILFSQINNSVHHQGKGLSDITYQTKTSRGRQSLLRQPEIIHLQDVANLLDFLKIAVMIAVVFWVLLFVILAKRYQSMPSVKFQLLSLSGLLLLGFLLIAVLGPEEVFNTLHIWVFPKDHQWFFYYQESLMSTMMLAPILFGWISILWLVVALVLYGFIILLLSKVLSRGS